MSRWAPLSLALLLSLTPAALSAGPDDQARSLFAAGQYTAAAAAFESLWRSTHSPLSGVNAVVAWRTAGKYVHARLLLEEVAQKGIPASLEQRVQLLRSRLDTLTGTILLQGNPSLPAILVRIDGDPAPTLGGVLVAPVGRHELTVEREGCQTFRWIGTIKPSQRLTLPYRLECTALPGSLHITLDAPWADSRVDHQRLLSENPYDIDTSLSPGPHSVEVRRHGIVLYESRAEIRSGEKTSLQVPVPWRAKSTGLVVGATSATWAGIKGASAAAGATVGYIAGIQNLSSRDTLSPAVSFLALTHLGISTSTLGSESDARLWFAVTTGAYHVLPVPWQTRAHSVTWVLDFEPALVTLSIANRVSGDAYAPTIDRVLHFGFVPVTLTAETPLLHLDLTWWPVGMSAHGGKDWWNGDFGYSTGLTLTAGWSLLGR